MSDKPSCENCGHCQSGGVIPYNGCKNYSHWQRDPHKWLAILPTEPGTYWFRKHKTDTARVIEVYRRDVDQKLYGDMPSGFGMQLSMMGGEWQGPIAPRNQ